ncbi:thermonuclease family protein [Stappia sp. F7233]|uniref:Thermonuclease family protein n=1 Tax=Stappia albiluteola TaxID=2758565 RepID=A0A839AGL0_9HYPH|nr:thermonuclease family protein [Stappia albiluteola]MBA5778226.1 thermonuclease family protein [Stappia albiluteola]
MTLLRELRAGVLFFALVLAAASLGTAALSLGLVGLAEIARAEALPRPAPAWPVCQGGDRAARGVTCVVDGDTFWLAGEKYRLACVDALELREPGGVAARNLTARLLALPGVRIVEAGKAGAYGRKLARVQTRAGDLGKVLVSAGLARKVDYANTRGFCRRGW